MNKANQTVCRGDIFYADLSPVVGSEQGGIRPVLILQNDVGNRHSPTTIVCAITARPKKPMPTHIAIGSVGRLSKNSFALLEQIRTIDNTRLREKISWLDKGKMEEINTALSIWGDYENEPEDLSASEILDYEDIILDRIEKEKLPDEGERGLAVYLDIALRENPKQLISFNPMQYVTIRGNNDDSEIFDSGAEHTTAPPVITDDQYKQLTEYLEQTQNPALLSIQIAYYTGLRLGEVCGLTWQDIDLDEQYLTVRRSICYNNVRKRTIIGPTKRKKIRTVDFCDTLAEILRAAKQEQKQGKQRYGDFIIKTTIFR